MPFLIVACGAMRSSRPMSFSPGTASTSICTLLIDAHPGHIGLIDVRVDDRARRGPRWCSTSVPLFTPLAPETAWPTETEPRQDRAVKGRGDFRLRQLVLDELQRLLRALEIVFRDLERVLRDIQFEPRVVEDFLRDELALVQLLGAIEGELHLLRPPVATR